MLIINNGSRKTGTTWIQKGIYATLQITSLPKEFQNTEMGNPSVAPELLSDFIDNHDQNLTYYSKNHFLPSSRVGNQKAREVLLDRRIYFFNSIRNLGDALVSWYHHCIRMTDTGERFDDWFWSHGMAFVRQYASHHTGWHRIANPFLFSFEAMKNNPHKEFKKFFEFMDIPFRQSESIFNEQMSFDTQASRNPSAHLRSGLVGERKEYLSRAMIVAVQDELERYSFRKRMTPIMEKWDLDPATLEI